MPNFFRNPLNVLVPGANQAYNAVSGHDIGQPGASTPQGDRQNEQQQFQSAQWDPNTFMPTSGNAPPAAQAANYDWQSQRLYQEAKNRYFTDALGSNQQALSTLGGYRSGGAASAAAGILQNRSSLQFNMGNSLERPDVFANARQAASQAALNAQKKAANMQLLGGVIGAGAGLAGMLLGGPPGAAAGAAVGGAAAGAAGRNNPPPTLGGTGALASQVAPSQGGQGGAAPAPIGSGGPQVAGGGGPGGGQGSAGGMGGGAPQGGGRVAAAAALAPEAEAFNAGAMHLIAMNDSFYQHANQAVDSYGYRLPNFYQGVA